MGSMQGYRCQKWGELKGVLRCCLEDTSQDKGVGIYDVWIRMFLLHPLAVQVIRSPPAQNVSDRVVVMLLIAYLS